MNLFFKSSKIIHFSKGSTETKMDYFHKDDNIPGTYRPSKLFFVNIYLQ